MINYYDVVNPLFASLAYEFEWLSKLTHKIGIEIYSGSEMVGPGRSGNQPSDVCFDDGETNALKMHTLIYKLGPAPQMTN